MTVRRAEEGFVFPGRACADVGRAQVRHGVKIHEPVSGGQVDALSPLLLARLLADGLAFDQRMDGHADKYNSTVRVLLYVFLIAAFLPMTAAAQSYPSKPMRLIVPFPPGGSNDVVGRMIAVQLSTQLDKPVIVENQGGAGGLIGTEMAARAQPDGYTLLLISVAYAFNPAIYKLPYDPATAFAPVAMLGAGPVVIAVTSKLPVSSVKELIALAKQKPGELNYATAGVGSFQHLASELFKQQAGVDIVHIPFKGGGPPMIDLIARNTQISIVSPIQLLPQIKAGKLQALGVSHANRIAG